MVHFRCLKMKAILTQDDGQGLPKIVSYTWVLEHQGANIRGYFSQCPWNFKNLLFGFFIRLVCLRECFETHFEVSMFLCLIKSQIVNFGKKILSFNTLRKSFEAHLLDLFIVIMKHGVAKRLFDKNLHSFNALIFYFQIVSLDILEMIFHDVRYVTRNVLRCSFDNSCQSFVALQFKYGIT